MHGRRTILAGAIAGILACVFSAEQAGAYEVDKINGHEIKWGAGRMSYLVNPLKGPTGALAAIQKAAGAWTAVPTSTFSFVYAGPTAKTLAHWGDNDGQNIVVFGNQGNGDSIAVNMAWRTSTGQMLDSDIVYNLYYRFSTIGAADRHDVWGIGAHEFGHSLVLNDLYGWGDSEKTMYGYASPGDLKKRTLDQDDIEGISYMYRGGLPAVVAEAADRTAAEAGLAPGEFTIRRFGAVGLAPLTVPLTVTGTAKPGVDYQRLPNRVTIPAGAASVPIQVTPIDDAELEEDETVIVTVGAGTGYTVGNPKSATVKIITDEGISSISVTMSPPPINECATPSPNGPWFAFHRAGPNASPITVAFTLAGTAQEGLDFSLSPRTVTFPAGESFATIHYGFLCDAIYEPNEEFTLTLRPGFGYTVGSPASATVTLVNVDKRPTLTWANTFTVPETSTQVSSMGFHLTAPLAQDLRVDFTVSGTATEGTDYLTIPRSVTFKAGSTSASFVFGLLDDSLVEEPETITITVPEMPERYILGSPSVQTKTITSDDGPTVTIGDIRSNFRVYEADGIPANLVVTRNGATTSPLTVYYTLGGTATEGLDYETLPHSVTILPGAASAVITVTPINDGLTELDETTVVQLSTNSAYMRAELSQQSVHIVSDEAFTVCKGGGCLFEKIQDAISYGITPGTGRRIHISPGTYRESLYMDSGQTLAGVGDGQVVVTGGLSLSGSGSVLHRVFSVSNMVFSGAGEYYTVYIGADSSTVQFWNTMITGSKGSHGGMYIAGDDTTVTLERCTIAGNTTTALPGTDAGGIYIRNAPNSSPIELHILDSLVWGNYPSSSPDILIQQYGVRTTGTDLVSVFAHNSGIGSVGFAAPPPGYRPGLFIDQGGVFSSDPVFVNPALNDFHINADSPAIDIGNRGIMGDDFEGDRAWGQAEDIGADEYTGPRLSGVKLTSLDGGERIAQGELYNITWDAPSAANSFRVWYSLDGGATWVSLTPAPIDASHLVWNVPLLNSNRTNCLVRVEGTHRGVKINDTSNGPFAIDVVRLTSPNGRESWCSGTARTVTWATTRTVREVVSTDVQYSLDGKTDWITVGSLPGNPGTFSWNPLPTANSVNTFRMRVLLRDAGGRVIGQDDSDATLSIGNILLISPNGGEVIHGGEEVHFEWCGVPGKLATVSYSYDGVTYKPMTMNYLSSWYGYAKWPAVSKEKPTAFLKIEGKDATGTLVGIDESDGSFRVVP